MDQAAGMGRDGGSRGGQVVPPTAELEVADGAGHVDVQVVIGQQVEELIRGGVAQDQADGVVDVEVGPEGEGDRAGLVGLDAEGPDAFSVVG